MRPGEGARAEARERLRRRDSSMASALQELGPAGVGVEVSSPASVPGSQGAGAHSPQLDLRM